MVDVDTFYIIIEQRELLFEETNEQDARHFKGKQGDHRVSIYGDQANLLVIKKIKDAVDSINHYGRHIEVLKETDGLFLVKEGIGVLR